MHNLPRIFRPPRQFSSWDASGNLYMFHDFRELVDNLVLHVITAISDFFTSGNCYTPNGWGEKTRGSPKTAWLYAPMILMIEWPFIKPRSETEKDVLQNFAGISSSIANRSQYENFREGWKRRDFRHSPQHLDREWWEIGIGEAPK